MPILGIVLLLIVPYLIGTVITEALREKAVSHLYVYVTGFLSLFVVLLACLLVALKKDYSLCGLEKCYFMYVVLPLSVVGVALLRKRTKIEMSISVNKRNLFSLIPAILLAVFSYIYLAPSFLNDDTWEVVSTTLAHESLYEYSAMTGKLMEAGLPIFNKVYVMPMFYACMCDFFKIPMWVIAGILMPVILYSMNLCLINEIAKKASVKNREAFLLVYMIFLMAGTYLPVNGVPVTTGYALLREGYSGYAVAYGVAIPFVVLLLSEKKWLHGIGMAASVLGLVRLDRFFYALTDFLNSYHQINKAGKLLGVYFISVIASLVLLKLKNRKTPLYSYFLPGVLCAYVVVSIVDYLLGRKKKIMYFVGVCAVIFSAVSFNSFADGVTLKSTREYENQVKERLSQLKEEYGTDITIWADEDFMAVSRRIDGSVKTIYGRDDITKDYLIGMDYEDPGFALDYYYSYKNMHDRNPHFYPSSMEVDEAIEKAYEEGLTVLVE